MKKLLLLHKRHTADDSDIWRVAIRDGWKTERTDAHTVEEDCKGYDLVRYYGNTFHASLLRGKQLPFRFLDIPPEYLANLERFTHRKIDLLPFHELKVASHDRFIKPVNDKWFEAKVYKAGELPTGASSGHDPIYISEIAEFVDEVRCFVLDGVILTSSLYRINKQVWDLTGLPHDLINYDSRLKDTPIPDYVSSISLVCSDLPHGIVIDFGRRSDGTWSLIEFNEAYASGLYYCDSTKAFEVILASQTNL